MVPLRARKHWPRIAAAMAGLAALAAIGLLGGFATLDNWLSDQRFGLATRAASGNIVFVDIDSAALKSVGVWPWPRRIDAELLDRLMALGARQVVFDVDFSSASDETDDAEFARALADAGGFAYLAAFRQQRSDAAGVDVNLPLPRFLRNADPVAVNIALDSGGVARTYPLAVEVGPARLASAAALLAGNAATAATQVAIDFTIDPATIPRIGAAAVLDGRLDPLSIRGRKVVIGASAVELRDFFVVPRFGIVPGAILQVLAAETLSQSRSLRSLGSWPAIAALAAFALIVLRRRRPGIWPVVGAALALTALAEAAAAVLQAEFGILLETAMLDIGLVGSAAIVIIVEMRRRGIAKRRAEGRLRYLATHDVLTGALSRAGFTTAIADALRDGREVAVVALDLRRFGAINDSLGYRCGDDLLRQVSLRLGGVAPRGVARLGGNSFAVLVDSVDATDLSGFCRTLVDLIAFPYQIQSHQASVAVCAGATTSAISGTDPQIILAHADMALRATRRQAGSPVAIYDPAMQSALVERQRLDSLLRRAVFSDDITLAYQPQVDLASGDILGFEALARWTHPDLGAVPPQRFIGSAEETGLIVELGRRALDAACLEAARWPGSIRVAVNVSPVQFELGDVAADIGSALQRSGLDPRRLEIELTEGTFVRNLAAVTERLAAIRRMGVGIALDDFGTGYSSLAYLGRLPIDRIKIDQSFVRGMTEDEEARAVVATVVSLARALGKTVLAEGIETLAHVRLLQAAGCTLGQGYHFGRPTPAADLVFARPTLAAVG